MDRLLIKKETTYGTQPPSSADSLLLRPAGIALKIDAERRLVGQINARIDCPCCKTGIHIRVDVDQPL